MTADRAQRPSLRALTADVPLAKERELVDMVSHLGAATAQNDARGRQPFFRRLWAAASGADRREQADITRKILGHQQGLQSWVRELAAQGAITDIALARVAGHLREVQHRLAHTEEVAYQALGEVRELAAVVAELAREVDARLREHDRRLDEHEERITALERRVLSTELWQAAWSGFERSVHRWEGRGAYRSLPWAYQVALLARELSSGPCGVHEFVTGDDAWRTRLVEHVLADPRAADWDGRRGIDTMIDDAWRALPTTDHRAMVAELLGDGLPPGLRPPDGELSTAMTTGMAWAARAAPTRPEDPGRAAVDATLTRRGWFPTSMTAAEFVRRIVGEQADTVQTELRDRQRNRSQEEAPDES